MPSPDLKCDVCGNLALGVGSSPLAAVTYAWCSECLATCRHPWNGLVGALCGGDRHAIDDWVRPYIEATCAFYDKTEDELWAEAEQINTEYEKVMREAANFLIPIEPPDGPFLEF